MICSYLKIPEKYVRFILQDRLQFVHIPPVRMVKFQFLARIPVDLLPFPVMSWLYSFCIIIIIIIIIIILLPASLLH